MCVPVEHVLARSLPSSRHSVLPAILWKNIIVSILEWKKLKLREVKPFPKASQLTGPRIQTKDSRRSNLVLPALPAPVSCQAVRKQAASIQGRPVCQLGPKWQVPDNQHRSWGVGGAAVEGSKGPISPLPVIWGSTIGEDSSAPFLWTGSGVTGLQRGQGLQEEATVEFLPSWNQGKRKDPGSGWEADKGHWGTGIQAILSHVCWTSGPWEGLSHTKIHSLRIFQDFFSLLLF